MTTFYMVHWTGGEHNGGTILVSVTEEDSGHPEKYAMDLGMRRAEAMWSTPTFSHMEKLDMNQKVVWTSEWYR